MFSCCLHAEYYGLNSVKAVIRSFPDCDEGISPGDSNTDFGDNVFNRSYVKFIFVLNQ